MSFEGKKILITGASSGIGAACAEYFAIEGALLALVGRNAEKFQKVVDRIKENGVEIEPLIILADVSTDAGRIISETIEKYGSLDIVINNAGFAVYAPLETMKMEDFDAMMATNVRGAIELTQLAVPYLIESKGNIVNVSSVLGIMTAPELLGYAVSKASMDHFTICVAMDLADKGVRVNSINPAVIDTEFHHAALGLERGQAEYSDFLEQSGAKHPLKRVGTNEDCVNAIAFIASKKADFLTGVILPVDGGFTKKGAF